MSHNLYIAAITSDSGKSLVVLGLMELLSKRIDKVGFFRPVVQAGSIHDNDIELIRSRYANELPYETHYALTHEEARSLVAEGRYDELLKRVIEKYKALERQCDFVLCEGIDASDLGSAFVDNFDTRVANLLSAPIFMVVNAQDKQPAEVIDALRTDRETFVEAGCAIAATIVNRVLPAQHQAVLEAVEKIWVCKDPVFVLPEETLLAKPTMAEIANALNGQLLYGEGGLLNREVLSFKVAAMQVANFLSYLEEGGLIITPGDRADVILGCLASTFSDGYPNIAGIILTGGLALAPSLQKLIEGMTRWTVPIFSVQIDTYETATQINQVHAEITPDNDRKIALALGLFESHVDVVRMEEQISVSRSDRITPLMFEYDLIERARANKQHIVLPEGQEERILRAAEILLRRGVVELTLLGNETEIREKIAALGLNLDGIHIIDPMQSEWHEAYAQTYFEQRQHKGITLDFARDMMRDVSYFGTMMVYTGAADGMVSGALHTTAHTIRPALEFIRTQPGCSIVSSVFLMCLDDRVLVYGDCAVNPNPNPQQLADIAISSAATAEMFGIEPLIALLSYSTGESGKGEDVDKVKQATQIIRSQRPDLKVEGPIQYDAAVDESVAKTKLPGSAVAGHATVFIFPDLNTGNNTYKAVQRSANAVAIGPVLQGLRKPVNDLSRGCTVTDIVNTIAITAIQAQAV
ncbi:MAG: phosphate acetyltransferase [Oscillatoriophycideae cyanobacterium NC_groundwater_1537_Pr4_S-0.65um_50_18]|nr:phosphate acetyltransferase [Oscillatoriophycideae cyanobacterium NC_groundwater_1537_Pr4_S-0.65um_50_18]